MNKLVSGRVGHNTSYLYSSCKSRLFSPLLASILVIGLSACGKEDASAKISEPVALSSDLHEIYQSTCQQCHHSKNSGAPVTGDHTAWATRFEKGLEQLVENAMLGTGGMPPRGQCFECTPEQMKRLIQYMANPKS